MTTRSRWTLLHLNLWSMSERVRFQWDTKSEENLQKIMQFPDFDLQTSSASIINETGPRHDRRQQTRDDTRTESGIKICKERWRSNKHVGQETVWNSSQGIGFSFPRDLWGYPKVSFGSWVTLLKTGFYQPVTATITYGVGGESGIKICKERWRSNKHVGQETVWNSSQGIGFVGQLHCKLILLISLQSLIHKPISWQVEIEMKSIVTQLKWIKTTRLK
jgi:hypothetical protein